MINKTYKILILLGQSPIIENKKKNVIKKISKNSPLIIPSFGDWLYDFLIGGITPVLETEGPTVELPVGESHGDTLTTPLEQFSVIDVNHGFFFNKISPVFMDLFRPNIDFIIDFIPTSLSNLNSLGNYVNLITDVNVFFANYDLVFTQNLIITLFIFGIFLDYIVFGKSIIIQILSGVFIFIYNLTKKQLNTINFNFFFILLVIGFFVTISNLIGMITYSTTPTAQLALTFFLAAWFMFYVNSLSLILHNVTFFDMLFPTGSPLALAFLITPIEAVSYSFRKISLSVRLFANMMAGHTLLKVFAGFTYTYLITFQLTILLNSSIAFLLINPVLIALTGLEVGVAFIQGYVFLSLNAMYATDTKDLH